MSVKATLTLIVPGLLDAVDHLAQVPAQELPSLESFSRLLSRGKFRYFDKCDYYSYLFDYFAIDPQHPEFPAAAAVDYFYQFHTHQAYIDCLRDHCWVMRVDPCFMAADRDQLVLLESANIDLSHQEAIQLVDEINSFFQPYIEESFWRLELAADRSSPLSWFLRSSKPINVHTQPTSNVKGRSIKPFLLKGENQSSWLKLFNEFQMVLHQSEVNLRRKQQGKLPVNSVWFWGAGKLIKPSEQTAQTNLKTVYSNDPIVKGLSVMAHFNIHDLPHNLDELFMVKSTTDTVVIMDHLAEPVRNGDVYAWVDMMQLFEKSWLEPSLKALQSGRLDQLTFLTPAGIRLEVSGKCINHWWKRNRHYMHFFKK